MKRTHTWHNASTTHIERPSSLPYSWRIWWVDFLPLDKGLALKRASPQASGKNIIGGSFEDLAAIIALVKDKSRIGVCFDTCHGFAAGYDLRTEDVYNDTWKKFDDIIGLKYLKAFHVNDSMKELGSRRDLHQNIGELVDGYGRQNKHH